MKFLFALIFLAALSFNPQKLFSQTVYVNSIGTLYHTNKCKLYAKSFEAVPLHKAIGQYKKRPCPKCKPPTKEVSAHAKKPTPKPKPAPVKKQ